MFPSPPDIPSFVTLSAPAYRPFHLRALAMIVQCPRHLREGVCRPVRHNARSRRRRTSDVCRGASKGRFRQDSTVQILLSHQMANLVSATHHFHVVSKGALELIPTFKTIYVVGVVPPVKVIAFKNAGRVGHGERLL